MGRDRAPVLLGEREYRWEELELTEAPDQGWAHHGVAVLDDGSVVAAAPDRACLVRLDVSGRELSRMDLELVEMHGITVSSDARAERLWVADNGHKFVPGQPGYGEVNRPGRVVAIELDGSMHQEIAAPDWLPTSGTRGSRAPWQSTTKRSAAPGTSGWPTGTDRACCIASPLLARGSPPSTVRRRARSSTRPTTSSSIVVVACRSCTSRTGATNVWSSSTSRATSSGPSGKARSTSPSGLATSGDLLFVAELHGRLAAFDRTDTVVGYLGTTSSQGRQGWPNSVDDLGNLVRVPEPGTRRLQQPARARHRLQRCRLRLGVADRRATGPAVAARGRSDACGSSASDLALRNSRILVPEWTSSPAARPLRLFRWASSG